MVGENYFVSNTGSHYSGEIGECIEQLSKELKLKRGSKDWLKIRFMSTGEDMWFKVSELTLIGGL